MGSPAVCGSGWRGCQCGPSTPGCGPARRRKARGPKADRLGRQCLRAFSRTMTLVASCKDTLYRDGILVSSRYQPHFQHAEESKYPPAEQYGAKHTPVTVKLWLPPRQSRGISQRISFADQAPSGRSSQRLPFPLAAVPQPHRAEEAGDRSAGRTCHRAHHPQIHVPLMDQAVRTRA